MRRSIRVHEVIDGIPKGIYFTAADIVAMMKRTGTGRYAATVFTVGHILHNRPDVENCGISKAHNCTLWRRIA